MIHVGAKKVLCVSMFLNFMLMCQPTECNNDQTKRTNYLYCVSGVVLSEVGLASMIVGVVAVGVGEVLLLVGGVEVMSHFFLNREVDDGHKEFLVSGGILTVASIGLCGLSIFFLNEGGKLVVKGLGELKKKSETKETLTSVTSTPAYDEKAPTLSDIVNEKQ